MPLQVQGIEKTKLEVHGNVRTELRVKNSYKIQRLQVKSSDKTKLEVHGSVRAWL